MSDEIAAAYERIVAQFALEPTMFDKMYLYGAQLLAKELGVTLP